MQKHFGHLKPKREDTGEILTSIFNVTFPRTRTWQDNHSTDAVDGDVPVCWEVIKDLHKATVPALQHDLGKTRRAHVHRENNVIKHFLLIYAHGLTTINSLWSCFTSRLEMNSLPEFSECTLRSSWLGIVLNRPIHHCNLCVASWNPGL